MHPTKKKKKFVYIIVGGTAMAVAGLVMMLMNVFSVYGKVGSCLGTCGVQKNILINRIADGMIAGGIVLGISGIVLWAKEK